MPQFPGINHSFLAISTVTGETPILQKLDSVTLDVLHEYLLPFTYPIVDIQVVLLEKNHFSAFVLISSSCEVLILDYETLELCQHSITPLGCFTAGVWTEYALKLPLKGTEHVIGHCILSTGAQLLATSIGRVVKLSSSFLPASIAFDGPKKPSLFACGSPRNFRLAQFARLTQSSAVIIFDEGALVLLTEPESNKAMPISGVSGDLSGEISGSGENQIFCTSDTTVRIYEVSRTRLTEIATFQSQNSETVRGFLNDRKFVLESATGWKLVDSDGQPIATGEKKPCCGGDISVSISAQVVFENNSQKIQLGVVRTGSGNLNFEISDHSVMCPEGTYPREIPVWPKFPIERWLGDLKLRQLLPIAMPSRGDWRANLREAYGEISDRVISFCLSSQAPRHLLEPNVLWALACRSQREVDVALAVAADFNPGVITAEARERLLSLDAVEDRLRDVIDRNSQANAITAQSLLAFLISKAQTSNLSFAYLPYPRDHGFRSAPMSFEDVMGYHDKVVPQDIPQHVPVESEIGNRDSSADVGQITAAPQTELGETNKALSLDFAAGPLPGERAEDAFESVELHPSVITVEYPTGDLGQVISPKPRGDQAETGGPKREKAEHPVSEIVGPDGVRAEVVMGNEQKLNDTNDCGFTLARSTISLGLQSHASLLVLEDTTTIFDFSRFNLHELFAEGRRLLEQRRVYAAAAAFGEGVDRINRDKTSGGFLPSFVLYRHVASAICSSRGHSDPATVWTLLLRFPLTDGEILAVAKHAVSSNFKTNRRRQAAAIADKVLNSPLVDLLGDFHKKQLQVVRKLGLNARPVEAELRCPVCGGFLTDPTQTHCLTCRAAIAVDWTEFALRSPSQLSPQCKYCRATFSCPTRSYKGSIECPFCLNC